MPNVLAPCCPDLPDIDLSGANPGDCIVVAPNGVDLIATVCTGGSGCACGLVVADLLTIGGTGEVGDPYTVGMTPGSQPFDFQYWDGASWVVGQACLDLTAGDGPASVQSSDSVCIGETLHAWSAGTVTIDLPGGNQLNLEVEPSTDAGNLLTIGTDGKLYVASIGLEGGVGVTIKKAGTPIGTRPAINLLEGTGISITAVDDPGDNEVDVTITATGGGGSGTDPDAVHVNVPAEISAVPLKATPVSADVFLAEDSADSFNKVRVPFSSMPGAGGGGPGSDTTAIHTDQSAEISGLPLKAVPVAADVLVGEDSGSGFSKVRIPWSSLPVIGGGSLPAIAAGYGGKGLIVPNVAETAYILIKSRGVFVDAFLGTEADEGADIRAACDSIKGDGGVVMFSPRDFFVPSTTTDDSQTVGFVIHPFCTAEGSGSGNIRYTSGPAADGGATNIIGTTAMTRLMKCTDVDTTGAEWRGARVKHLHLGDGSASANQIDVLLNIKQGNQAKVEDVSFGDVKKSGSVAIMFEQAPGGQTTQYCEVRSCQIVADHGGIQFAANAPDNRVIECDIISRLGASPSVNSYGIYADSSAIKVRGGAIQFWDRCIWIDGGTSNEGKHTDIDDVHFEGHQSAATDEYEAVVYISGGSGGEYPRINGCEIGNGDTYTDYIVLTGSVEGTRVRDWRNRGSSWLTGAHAKLNLGGNPIDVA